MKIFLHTNLISKLLTFLSFVLLTQPGKAASSLEELGGNTSDYKPTKIQPSSSTNRLPEATNGVENPIIRAAFEAAKLADQAANVTHNPSTQNKDCKEADDFEKAIKAYKASRNTKKI